MCGSAVCFAVVNPVQQEVWLEPSHDNSMGTQNDAVAFLNQEVLLKYPFSCFLAKIFKVLKKHCCLMVKEFLSPEALEKSISILTIHHKNKAAFESSYVVSM